MAKNAQAGNWLRLAASLAGPFAAGGFGSLFMGNLRSAWYAGLAKPSFMPPGWAFGIVWPILYLLMGVAAFLVWRRGLGQGRVRVALILFAGQLVLNAAWTPAFFGLRMPGAGLAVVAALWAMVAATLWAFARVSRLSAGLLGPYLAWVTFAGVLNGSICWLNR